MHEPKSARQRLAGYAVLALVAGLMALGWRAAADTTAQADAPSPSQEVTTDDAAAITVADAADPVAVPVAPVIEDIAFVPAAVPQTFIGRRPEHQLQTYTVERGDTPNGIADKFGIQATTLLGGNPLLSQESSLLQTGVTLIILPIDGVLHDVQPGDTLESIAAQYSVPSSSGSDCLNTAT